MLQKLSLSLLLAALVAGAVSAPQESHAADGKKKVVFVAGRPSHGYASHEHYAGCMLLAKTLEASVPGFDCVVVRDGYPKDLSLIHI